MVDQPQPHHQTRGWAWPVLLLETPALFQRLEFALGQIEVSSVSWSVFRKSEETLHQARELTLPRHHLLHLYCRGYLETQI